MTSRNLRIPIWVKLVSIVTMLIFFSLGLITFLVAFFISSDVAKTADENNFNINEMSAQRTLNELTAMKSNTLVLLKSAADNSTENTYINKSGENLNFFFTQNKEIIGIALRDSINNDIQPEIITNKQNAMSGVFSESMFIDFILNNEAELNRALIGDTLLFNAAGSFSDTTILAMSFPVTDIVSRNFLSAIVFFDSLSLIESFSTGDNSTIVINSKGDILISSDPAMLRNGANISYNVFIKNVLANADILIKSHFKDIDGQEFIANSRRVPDFNIIVISTIPSEIIFEGIRATTRRNIYLSLLVWFVSVLFVWFFSKSISNPLRELKDAVQNIEEGNYHINLKSASEDETGILTNSIQNMSNILGNFERFTNKSLARLASKGLLAKGGAQKSATIFFSDIRAFTEISEKLTSNEVVEFLNEYIARVVSCVIATGGAIDKFIGDAVMAHWGAEESSGSFERDAYNGVRCALMIRASLMSFNKDRGGDPKKPIIHIGCGLNSGNVVAGQIGSKERVVYTVIGAAVTFAERCETFNKTFGTEVIISENTYNLVEKYLICEQLGTVTEGGKKVKIFAVVNFKEAEEGEKLLGDLQKLYKNDSEKIDKEIAVKCIGENGPKTLEDLRTLLGIELPTISNINLDDKETKYSLKNDKN